MKKIIIFATFFLSIAVAFSEINPKLKINIADDRGGFFDKLIFGLEPGASYDIDTALGEYAAPPMHPPTGLHGAFRVVDSRWGLLFTYNDYRGVPAEKDTFFYQYRIDLQKASATDSVIFSWYYPIPKYIDSIVITDIHGMDFVYIKLGEQRTETVKNLYIEDFFVNVWYNKKTLSNQEYEIKSANSAFVYPNPSDGKNIYIKAAAEDAYSYVIYDNIGIEVACKKWANKGEPINAERLAKGVYVLKLQYFSGKTEFIKFSII